MGKQDFDNYDKSRAEEFASKMFQFLNGGMLSLMISIGYKTGLFDILSVLEPSTSQEIAQETKLDERYVREWLGAMVTGKIVNYDPLTRKYNLPKEHSAFLTRKSGVDMERVQLLLFSLSYSNEKVAKLNMSYLNSNCT
jgi:hypothetical protein